MSLSELIRCRPTLRVFGIVLALSGLILLPGCWVYSMEPLYEENLNADPDLTFDPSLLGSWARSDDGCTWTLTITADQKVYEFTMSPAPNCKGESTRRYDGRLLKLDNHRFLDLVTASDEVCDLCLPVHSFFRVSQQSNGLALTPIDLDWMLQAIETKKVVLAHLQRQKPLRRSEVVTKADAIVLTASSADLKEFVRKYADDEAVFKPDSAFKFRRR